MLWNCIATTYLGIRLLGYFQGRAEAWSYILTRALETVLWVLPVFFIGYEGGLLAKKHVFGELYISSAV